MGKLFGEVHGGVLLSADILNYYAENAEAMRSLRKLSTTATEEACRPAHKVVGLPNCSGDCTYRSFASERPTVASVPIELVRRRFDYTWLRAIGGLAYV